MIVVATYVSNGHMSAVVAPTVWASLISVSGLVNSERKDREAATRASALNEGLERTERASLRPCMGALVHLLSMFCLSSCCSWDAVPVSNIFY